MDQEKIGKFISKKRLEKNLTQNELGEKLFVTGKAVSKWERGLSLPDITILEKLAEILDTDIYGILQIKKKKDIDINKILEEERLKIKKQIQKRILLLCIPIFILAIVTLFKLIPFGYDIEHVRYTHNTNKLVNFGVPKFSFFMKNKEDNFSYKSLRGKAVLGNEIKTYLNSLEHLSCNDTIYYYDSSADVTIVEYSVTGNLFYNTISYHIRNGNYCKVLKKKEYLEILIYPLSIYREYALNPKLNISLVLSISGEDKFEVLEYIVYYYDESKKENVLIEYSSGTFEIVKDELIYYREDIKEQISDIKIPKESHFIMRDDRKLILKDKYLDKYEKNIVLKDPYYPDDQSSYKLE